MAQRLFDASESFGQPVRGIGERKEKQKKKKGL